MFELAKNELKRYQKWAWLWALLILALHILIMRFRPFLEPSAEEGALNNLLLMGGSFLFGLVQMALHKRKNHWTFLIHRPLSPVKIYSSIFVAGAMVIFIAGAVPWILTILGLDLFGKGIVEFRHYSYIFFMILSCLMMYQVATLVVTNASWGICLVSVLLVLVLAPKAHSAMSQFVPVIVFNMVLFYLNCQSFKPDLSTYVNKPFAQILLAIPISFGLVYILLMSTTVYYHLPKFAMGTHPDNNPVQGSFRYMFTLKESEFFSYALSEEESWVDKDLAKSIIQQADIANVSYLSLVQNTPPWRFQLHIDDFSYQIVNTTSDKHHQKSWQFSHKNMVLIAHNKMTGKESGVIGKNGFLDNASVITDMDRFDEVPYMYRNKYLVFSDKIVFIDFEQEELSEKYTLQEGEQFAFVPQTNAENDLVFAFTNKRILLFDANMFAYEYAELQHSFAAMLPKQLDHIDAVMAAELADGYALLFYGRDFFGRDNSGSSVYYLPFDGEPVVVGSRQFTVNSHPYWIEQFDYLVSPLLFLARNAAFNLIDPTTFKVVKIQEMSVNHIAVALHIISILILILLMRFHTMSITNKLLWIVFVLLSSVPGLLSFVLLHPFKGVYKSKRIVQEYSAHEA